MNEKNNVPKMPKIKTDLQNSDIKKKFEILKKINENITEKNAIETTTKYSFLVKHSPKLQILIDKHLMDKHKEEKISCNGLCYAIYLVFKNFGLKCKIIYY